MERKIAESAAEERTKKSAASHAERVIVAKYLGQTLIYGGSDEKQHSPHIRHHKGKLEKKKKEEAAFIETAAKTGTLS